MSELAKYMPNILDFENKRAHFKREITKLKRENRYGRMNLDIRRSDMLTEAYNKMNHKSAQEFRG